MNGSQRNELQGYCNKEASLHKDGLAQPYCTLAQEVYYVRSLQGQQTRWLKVSSVKTDHDTESNSLTLKGGIGGTCSKIRMVYVMLSLYS